MFFSGANWKKKQFATNWLIPFGGIIENMQLGVGTEEKCAFLLFVPVCCESVGAKWIGFLNNEILKILREALRI